MLQTTRAIVLRSIPYSGSSRILRVYSRDYGTHSYMVKGVGSGKKRFKPVIFLPLTELEIIARHRNTPSLDLLRDVRVVSRYEHLHSHIPKQSIVLFVSEVLTYALGESGAHEQLYDFLVHAFKTLDETGENIAGFHLLFLVELTRHLGVYPGRNDTLPYFDMLEGRYTALPTSDYAIDGEKLMLFNRLLGTEFEAFYTLNADAHQRNMLLDMLLDYYRLHIPHFKEPNSKKVLYEVFHS